LRNLWLGIVVVAITVFAAWHFFIKTTRTDHQQAFIDALNRRSDVISSLAKEFSVAIDGKDPSKSTPTVSRSRSVEISAVFPPLADRKRSQFLELRLFPVTESGVADDQCAFSLMANGRSICFADPLMEHPENKKVQFRRVATGRYLVKYNLVRWPLAAEEGTLPENLLVGQSQLVVME